MNLSVWLVTALATTAAAGASNGARPIIACIDDRPWIPYTNPDRSQPGEMQELVKDSVTDLGLDIRIVALPWKRCQESVRSGKIDALIGAGDVPYNHDLATFPQLSGSTDTARSLGSARIMLVRAAGSKVDWDGKSFHQLSRPVGVALGTQVMKNAVLAAGGGADDGAKTDDQNLRKLLQNRVDLMAAYEHDLEEIIPRSYQGLVEILPIPLSETNYYLAFSKQFAGANPQLVEQIWNRLPLHRGSSQSRARQEAALNLFNTAYTPASR